MARTATTQSTLQEVHGLAKVRQTVASYGAPDVTLITVGLLKLQCQRAAVEKPILHLLHFYKADRSSIQAKKKDCKPSMVTYPCRWETEAGRAGI